MTVYRFTLPDQAIVNGHLLKTGKENTLLLNEQLQSSHNEQLQEPRSLESMDNCDEAVRRFATRRVTTSSSLSMLSANLAKDSSRVGGLDGLDVGGGVYEGWSG
ncbi:hypothetical protein Tco_0644222 [Tanacetum coccineum]